MKHKPHCPKCQDNIRVIYYKTNRFVDGHILKPAHKYYSVYKCNRCQTIIDQIKDGVAMGKENKNAT